MVPLNIFREIGSGNELGLILIQATLGRIDEVLVLRFFERPSNIALKDEATQLSTAHVGVADASSTPISFFNGVDESNYREPPRPPSNLPLHR